LLFAASAFAQTADELVAKNLQAKGGIEKIKAIKSLRMTAALMLAGSKPRSARRATACAAAHHFSVQGMTQSRPMTAPRDGRSLHSRAAKIPNAGRRRHARPGGRRDFDGPLVDALSKGNKIESMGHDQVDGDDAYSSSHAEKWRHLVLLP